ncbi:MAG: glycosyltransferase family 39 protein, partial [Planctomycetes bacterium]|nr:glycosyltransferase family 39 protein [Planctomycetota bacterium]
MSDMTTAPSGSEDRITGDLDRVSMNLTGKRRFLAPSIIVVIGLALYVPNLRWGLPGTVSWSQDTIAAMRTLGAARGWPEEWKGRYPPLHYLLLDSMYQPVVRQWQRTGECAIDPATQGIILAEPHAPKLSRLFLIARIVSVVMAIATGLGVYCTARLLTGDVFASCVAAVTLMIGGAFTYFAHLGNVDIPVTCWFAWSAYAYVRSLGTRRWIDCALLGLLGALATSTKDSVAGVYPGMAVVLLVTEWRFQLQLRSTLRSIVSALVQIRWLIGLVAFIIPVLYINGVFHDPAPYLNRMSYWLDASADTLHAKQYRYSSRFGLLTATMWYGAGAVGWPLLTAMLVSTVYTLRRHTRIALILLAPAVSYYLIVIAQIDFVYSRFLFPPLALLGILVGIAATDLRRNRRLPIAVRSGLPLFVVLLSLGYSAGLVIEMGRDTRYQAERWFEQNVKPPSSIGAFLLDDEMPLRPQYLPRVREMGYATYPVAMRRDSFEQPQPEYLMLSSFNY